MTPRLPARLALPLTLALACAPAGAQQLIGYISTRDAAVTGATDVIDDRAVLAGSVSVTARDHTAAIALARGGTVSVCQTSVLHVTESREVAVAAPLLFSLDRGAIEISTKASASDAIMTPDLRFTVRSSGPLDLRLRVAGNGDTCVENRGAGAPTLAVSDPFGAAQYEVAAGQHVLFEHGSLLEVVDHETIPCGCPDAKGVSVADALLAPSNAAHIGAKSNQPAPPPVAPPAATGSVHPFPTAQSEGLAPPEAAPPEDVPPTAAATIRPQVNDVFAYYGATSDPEALQPGKPAPPPATPHVSAPVAPPVQTAAAAPSPAPVPAPPPAPAPIPTTAPAPAAVAPQAPSHDLVHAVGRFFHRLFRR